MQGSLGTILVTGGAGYIGSHTSVALLEAGYHVVIFDNLSNSHREVLTRIEDITSKPVDFIIGDVRDANALKQCFNHFKIDAVIHFAGLKAVGESVENPLKYFDHNVHGTTQLLNAMQNANVKKSSLAHPPRSMANPVICHLMKRIRLYLLIHTAIPSVILKICLQH